MGNSVRKPWESIGNEDCGKNHGKGPWESLVGKARGRSPCEKHGSLEKKICHVTNLSFQNAAVCITYVFSLILVSTFLERNVPRFNKNASIRESSRSKVFGETENYPLGNSHAFPRKFPCFPTEKFPRFFPRSFPMVFPTALSLGPSHHPLPMSHKNPIPMRDSHTFYSGFPWPFP